MKIYQITLIILLSSSCAYDPGDKRLKIINHTNHEITMYWHADTIPEYPSVDDTEIYIREKISVGDSSRLPEFGANWPRFVQNSINRKLNLFVYNVDSLEAYKSIDTLNVKRIYKRLEYSESELDKLNWRIVIKK